MIPGRNDTFYTVAEFASMIDRDEKTVRNWAATGKIQFVHLCGVPLVSLTQIENLITNHVPADAKDGMTALKMMNKAK